MIRPAGTTARSLAQLARRVLAPLKRLLPSATQIELERAADDGWTIDTPDRYCPRCGGTVDASAVTQDGCPHCRGKSIAWDRLLRLSPYAPPVDGWILAMKFASAWTWAPWLGEQLAWQIKTHNSAATEAQRTAVCPVPMHLLRRWHRGYNQARLMAEALAKSCRWPMVDLLRRTRHTPPQTAVAPSQRLDNVRDSFACKPVDLAGWDICLVDDVKTTGSTLSVCARLLKQAGARSVHIAVAAVADPKHADFKVL